MIDIKLSFKEHQDYTGEKAANARSYLARMMPKIARPKSSRRPLMHSTVCASGWEHWSVRLTRRLSSSYRLRAFEKSLVTSCTGNSSKGWIIPKAVAGEMGEAKTGRTELSPKILSNGTRWIQEVLALLWIGWVLPTVRNALLHLKTWSMLCCIVRGSRLTVQFSKRSPNYWGLCSCTAFS